MREGRSVGFSRGLESGLDRLDSVSVRVDELVKDPRPRRRRRFAPSLTSSSTRTIGSQAIKAAIRSAEIHCYDIP
jgi:hypothetical protein